MLGLDTEMRPALQDKMTIGQDTYKTIYSTSGDVDGVDSSMDSSSSASWWSNLPDDQGRSQDEIQEGAKMYMFFFSKTCITN